MTRYNEFDRTVGMMDELRRRMDRVLEGYDLDSRAGRQAGLFHELERSFAPSGGKPFPRLSVLDAGESLVLKAELPGIADENVQISLHQEVLTLTGQRATEPPEGYSVHRQERPAAKFSRSFTLPCKVDPEKTTAVLKNGLLTVTMAKASEAQPRRIGVRAE